MGSTDISATWDKIQQGVKETERLLGQKQYNLSMVKARQTLEIMVRHLGERACIVEGDLVDNIDELYQGHWITKSSCEHYHKIRMIGNKAIHEADDNAYDANQAFHLLSQELYTFANEYSGRRKKAAPAHESRPASANRGETGRPGNPGSRTSSGSSRSGNGSRSSASRRPPSRSGSGSRRHGNKQSLDVTDFMKIGVVLLLVVFLIVLVRFFTKPDEKPAETTTEPVTTMATEAPTMPPTEPAIPEVAEIYKTTDRLNVRSGPSTDSDKLGLLESGTVVDYVQAYDDDWAIIMYNGAEAYVSSQYLSAQSAASESEAPAVP